MTDDKVPEFPMKRMTVWALMFVVVYLVVGSVLFLGLRMLFRGLGWL